MFGWFERRLDAFPANKPTMPPRTLVKFCLHYAKGAWPWLIIMSICTALIAIMEISIFGFLGSIVDWLAVGGRRNFLKDQGVTLGFLALVIVFLLPLIVAIHSLVLHQTLLGNFPMRIRWLIHRYLLGQSVTYFQNEFSGRIAAKVMQTSLAVRETVIKSLELFNYVCVYFAGTMIIAALADWRLTLPFISWLVVYVWLICYFIPRLRNASEDQAEARSMMTGRIIDTYTNIAAVKLFSHDEREENFARGGFDTFQTTVKRQMRLVSAFSISVYVANCILLFVIGALCIMLWLQDSIMVGAVAVNIALVLRLNGMSQWIMWEMSSLFENIGTVEDGIDTFSHQRSIENKDKAKPLVVKNGDVSFKNVCFHYGKGNGVLDKLNLEIPAGQKIGIVGRSGAGKSTLVNLLLRFYDVEKGSILIDGQNVADVTQESLRAAIGVVTQDTALLHRTLRENILYGRPTASEEEMFMAVQDAQADFFIDELRDHYGHTGYDAHVGERGALLSGGQRQRIAISRVMLKDAPILILDEATSSLDSEAEYTIQENLTRLMEGKTVLAIAHRLSTIAAMDRLIVMDKGKIIEDGTHEDLLKRDGIYAGLWKRQSGGMLSRD